MAKSKQSKHEEIARAAMVKFSGGPAGGLTLWMKRAPPLVRVTSDFAGNVDVLDQINDEPRDDEYIVVYRRTTDVQMIHVKHAKKSCSGMYARAAYVVMSTQPKRGSVRKTNEWQSWAVENKDAR